jgi:ligand-binding sensor domain-containing protein
MRFDETPVNKQSGRSKKCRKQFYFAFLLIFIALNNLVPFRSWAIDEVNNLSFDFYSQEHGLSNNQIHCVLQDKKGWMWIGTSQGVCRFDGYRFSVFKYDADDSTSLKGNLVRTVFEDSKGQLWVGTENGGLNKFNRERESFEQLFYHSSGGPLKNVSVTSIQEDRNGILWVGTETKLYRIENENKIEQLRPSNFSNFNEYFRVIRPDKNGRIWLGTNRGLYLYHPETNQADKIRLPELTNNEEIWEISPEDDGTIRVGTYAGGMFEINTSTLVTRQVIIDRENERSNTVRAISKAPNGKYWIGTRGGLYLYDKLLGVTAKYTHDDREPKSLVNNSVLCINRDANGNVWIGTRQGLNLLIEERINILGYKSMPGDNRYLNNGEIYTFLLDLYGNIWAGTENGGINILNRKTGRVN